MPDRDRIVAALDRERQRQGLSMHALARASGVAMTTIHSVFHRGGATLHTTHLLAEGLGLTLKLSPHPNRPRPIGTRTGQRSRDPHPDLVAVDRALDGDRTVVLTVLELGMAIAVLRRRGWSAKATARLLGVSDRTVTRHRAGLVRNAAPSTVEAFLSSRGCGQPRDTSVHRLSRGLSTTELDSGDRQDAA